MTTSRLAAYIGGASLLLAWMASAAGVPRQPARVQVPARADDSTLFATIAADVQSQATRLRKRIATAPAPGTRARNPFAFHQREVRPVRTIAPRAALPAAADEQPAVFEPALSLIGIAEEKTAVGLVRTAMISGGGDDLFMVTEGQTLLGRYRVVVVGSEAVELKDDLTGATRRLALQQ